MLEIIGIYFASKNIAEIAQSKGYSAGLYRFLTFLCWFGGELLGAVLGIILFGEESLIIYLVALGGAIGAFLLLKQYVNNLPTRTNNDASEIID